MADVDGPFWAGESRHAQGVASVAEAVAEHADCGEGGRTPNPEDLDEEPVEVPNAALHGEHGPFGAGKAHRDHVAEDVPEGRVDRGDDRAEHAHAARDGAEMDVHERPTGRRNGTAGYADRLFWLCGSKGW